MFENKKLDEIEKQIASLKRISDQVQTVIYGDWFGIRGGLIYRVGELEQKAGNLISETLPKLPPCPICGKKPKVDIVTVTDIMGDHYNLHTISCRGTASHTIEVSGSTYKQALHNWNRRNGR